MSWMWAMPFTWTLIGFLPFGRSFALRRRRCKTGSRANACFEGDRMPRMTAEYLDEFLRQPFVGVIATLRRDGRPYTVPVWYVLHEGSFWITGTYERVWCKQLARDPRASLCIEAMPATMGGPGYAGHVGVDGKVV